MHNMLAPYARALMGQHAVHVPLNFIVQAVDGRGGPRVCGVFQSDNASGLTFGSAKAARPVVLR